MAANKKPEGAGKKQGRVPPVENRFKPGQSGNPAGRPKGSRNKLGEAFLSALHEDFEEHGVAAIQQCRAENPVAYVKVIASILPKELNVTVDPLEEMTDEQLDRRIRQLAAALGLEARTGASDARAAEATRH